MARNMISSAALVLALALGAPAVAQTAPNTAVMATDFLKTASSSDEFERRSGRMTAERAQDARVRAFGEQMVAAHTRTTSELGEAARAAGQRVPAPALNPGQEGSLSSLAMARGADFDRLYLQQQHEAHKDALGLMETYARVGREPPLREAASRTAPMVAEHIAAIAQLQRSMR